MSGHPLHHHPSSGHNYPYSSSASVPTHPPPYHSHSTSHRSSISLPSPHPNGLSNSPHLPAPPLNSSSSRHGSVQVPPPSSVPQPHLSQPHPSHHQPILPAQPPPLPHHASHQSASANQSAASYGSSHHPQQSAPPASLHHSQPSHGHHLNHPRDHQQMKEYQPHASAHPHPHPHSLPPSQRNQRADPMLHRERDHHQPRSHSHIHPSSSDPSPLTREPPPREAQHAQSSQSVHAPLPHHPNSHPAASAPHPAHASNHHHHPSPAPPSNHQSPHPTLSGVPYPHSAAYPPGGPPTHVIHHHNGNSGGAGPGAHILSGPPQPALPPALPNNKSGGGPTGRQLAQPPPQAGVNGAPTAEEANVAAIIRDGEANLQSQMGNWRPPTNPLIDSLVKETELTWIAAGSVSESLGDYTRALECFERALKHNPHSIPALTKAAGIHRHQENFKAAANYFSRLLKIHENSGEIWGALGHCYLMLDELPRAYTSYQQALHHFPTPKSEPKLWYGIGILYDRYGSLEHAEEAFSSVILMDPHFEKANEIYFRLGIIYKQQHKAELSLECFQWILDKPPSPLTEIDIWFQIGHVHEQQGHFDQAKESYQRVLAENPNHAKVLQQLGGLYCREGSSFYDTSEAITILTRSVQADRQDPFTWYLLARVYMTMQNYTKAYESYQQAVYRNGRNPAFWCSIGVLYYAIGQYHDSLDAYSRAIRINPYLPEVWFNLGALYESCNDQMTDAVDAYQRAIQLDSNSPHAQRRLEEIRFHQDTGADLGPPPAPRDMNHTSPNWPFPNALSGPSEAGFGHSMIAHEETSRPAPSMTSPRSPASTRPISPSGPPTRSSIHRPGTSNSASGMRPQSAGPFAHAPPPNLQTSHHAMGHSGHSLPPAQQHVPQSATLDRRQSGGHGSLAPMEFEPSPRLGTRGAPSAQHNLPHIRSVVDSHSRGPSPAPSAPDAMRRPLSISGQGPGHRDAVSPRTSPSIRSNIALNDRVQYSSGSNGVSRPPPHHGPPQFYPRYPQSAVPVDDSLPPQPQPSVGAGGPMSRDRERTMRDPTRLRPHSPDFRLANLDRDTRPPPASASSMYPHRGSDHSGVNYPAPPQPQHQSPYDPRHASPGLRARTGPTRFESEQSSLASPSWPATDHRVGAPTTVNASPAVSSEERRPGSQSGYVSQHYPPGNMPPHHMSSNQHAPSARRYDPRYDETTIPSHRQSLSHDQASPPRPTSHNEDIERQKAVSAVRQAQRSPTPPIAASEFPASGNGSGLPRRTARAKQNNKEDDYSPANHARRRKLPISRSNTIANPAGSSILTSNHVGSVSQSVAPPATSAQTPPTVREGSQVREKKEKKKVANTKVRPAAMKTKVNESSKRPSPSPIPHPNPVDTTSTGGLQLTSPPPLINATTMPDRKVDEEFEEYDEVADALLSFAGQPPRRGPAPQPSPPDQSPHSAPVSTGSRSGAAKLTGSSRSVRSGNGVSPRSDSGVGVGSVEGRSPSGSSHSVAQRSAIDSPVRAGSSPESTLAQPYAAQRFHQQHGNASSPNPPGTTSMNSGPATTVAPAMPLSKRPRVDGSSPSTGDSCPEPKRSRSSVGRGGKGQPSPRSQSNSDTRSPLSGNVSNGVSSVMSLAGGKKSIMNEDPSTPDHLPNDATMASHRRASEGSSGNSKKLDEERDDNSPEDSKRPEDPQQSRYGTHEEADEDATMGEAEEDRMAQDNNVEGATEDEKMTSR